METRTVNIEGRDLTLLRYRDQWVFPEIASYAPGPGSPVYFGLLCLSGKDMEPYTTVTVNLPGCKRSAGCQFIDTNNNGEDIPGWLEENGFGERTGNFGRSGFCSYPEFNFHKGKKFLEYKRVNDEY